MRSRSAAHQSYGKKRHPDDPGDGEGIETRSFSNRPLCGTSARAATPPLELPPSPLWNKSAGVAAPTAAAAAPRPPPCILSPASLTASHRAMPTPMDVYEPAPPLSAACAFLSTLPAPAAPYDPRSAGRPDASRSSPSFLTAAPAAHSSSSSSFSSFSSTSSLSSSAAALGGAGAGASPRAWRGMSTAEAACGLIRPLAMRRTSPVAGNCSVQLRQAAGGGRLSQSTSALEMAARAHAHAQAQAHAHAQAHAQAHRSASSSGMSSPVQALQRLALEGSCIASPSSPPPTAQTSYYWHLGSSAHTLELFHDARDAMGGGAVSMPPPMHELFGLQTVADFLRVYIGMYCRAPIVTGDAPYRALCLAMHAGRGARTSVRSFCADQRINCLTYQSQKWEHESAEASGFFIDMFREARAHQPCVVLVHRFWERWREWHTQPTWSANCRAAMAALVDAWRSTCGPHAYGDSTTRVWLVCVQQELAEHKYKPLNDLFGGAVLSVLPLSTSQVGECVDHFVRREVARRVEDTDIGSVVALWHPERIMAAVADTAAMRSPARLSRLVNCAFHEQLAPFAAQLMADPPTTSVSPNMILPDLRAFKMALEHCHMELQQTHEFSSAQA